MSPKTIKPDHPVERFEAVEAPFRSVEPLSERGVRQALENCAREPIHIPGSIQPQGILLAMNRAGTIVQASANCEHYVGRSFQLLLGHPIGELLGEEQTPRLLNMAHYGPLRPLRSTIFDIETSSGLRRFDAISHLSGERTILELEPQDEGTPQCVEFFYDELRDFSIMLRGAGSLDDLYRHVVENIRVITGFDRVKLYRFDGEWNGEVIAESRAEHMPSYLGQHFPHSDIPAQARALYAKNYLRLISDISYRPVPIVSREASAAPLDLSFSVLRSVSPVHVQYLANMNVQASMSISIIQNNALWGLVACHHASPRHVPYRIRMVSELMGHIFSAQLSTLQEMQRKDQQLKRSVLIESLSSALEASPLPEKMFEERYEQALEVLSSAGLAVVSGSKITTYGETPDERIILQLLDWLRRRHPGILFHTNDLSTAFKQEKDTELPIEGGLLATPIGQRTRSYVLWFRPDQQQEIPWAGKPEKQLESTEAGFRLTPRGSFTVWQETVKGRSQPWRDDEIALARHIVSILLESEKMAALQASNAKSEFLANMSHELRTPMNAVIGIANILAKTEPLSNEQREFVSTLQISSHTLLALINDLLDISKIESTAMVLDHHPLNLCEIIEEARSLMALRAHEKKLHLNVTYPHKSECHFKGDALRLRQIVLNLVSNAIKFTDHGFVNVSMRLKSTGVEGQRMVQIEVSDTGIGMNDEQLTRIFDKFVQADPSISSRYGGTGLGLSITKHLVELTGGTVTVVSRVGMGTKFTVCLPLERHELVEEPLQEAPDLPETEPFVPTRGKILLTEDYEGNIMVALTYLQDLGYDVTVAKNGQEALDKFVHDKFDAVLMDVQMPVLDGYSATQRLRQMSDLPIIGMTAHALAGDREKCIEAGMDDYIAKPFTFEELKSKLELHIKAYQERQPAGA